MYMDLPVIDISGNLPNRNQETRCAVTYNGMRHECALRVKGRFSAYFGKKSYFIDFAEPLDLGWGMHTDYILNADYIDSTRTRNLVSAKLWSDTVGSNRIYPSLPENFRNSANNGASDGFPVMMYNNGRFIGVYNLCMTISSWSFNMDEDNIKTGEDFCIYCEDNRNGSSLFMNTATEKSFGEGKEWSVMVGSKANIDKYLTALNGCITDVLSGKVPENIYGELLIDYYLFCDFIMGFDNLANNMLLLKYGDCPFIPSVSDLDMTFGQVHGRTGMWTKNIETDFLGSNSLLWKVLRENRRDELRARWKELSNGLWSVENVTDSFEYYSERIGKENIERDHAIWHYPFYPENPMENISDFLIHRTAMLNNIYG